MIFKISEIELQWGHIQKFTRKQKIFSKKFNRNLWTEVNNRMCRTACPLILIEHNNSFVENTGDISPLITSGGICLSGNRDKPLPRDMSWLHLVMTFYIYFQELRWWFLFSVFEILFYSEIFRTNILSLFCRSQAQYRFHGDEKW